MNRRVGLQLLVLIGSSMATSLLCAHDGHEHGRGGSAERVWTLSDTGTHVHASFVAILNGKVQIRRTNGRSISLEIAKLKETDQKWIELRTAEIRQLNEDAKSPVPLSKLVAT